jgi:putative transposase
VEDNIMPKRKRRSAQFKFKVALEAARGTKTLSELSSEYEVHPSQISEWKSRLLKDGTSVFSTTTARQQRDQETLQAGLYEQIGRLKMELEWLKKKAAQ